MESDADIREWKRRLEIARHEKIGSIKRKAVEARRIEKYLEIAKELEDEKVFAEKDLKTFCVFIEEWCPRRLSTPDKIKKILKAKESGLFVRFGIHFEEDSPSLPVFAADEHGTELIIVEL